LVFGEGEIERFEPGLIFSFSGQPALLGCEVSDFVMNTDVSCYQQSCDKLTDRIEAVSLQTSKELAGEIKRLRWLFLGVGVLPIVGALIFLTVTLGLLQVVKTDGQDEF
jgi:hypothetical protein